MVVRFLAGRSDDEVSTEEESGWVEESEMEDGISPLAAVVIVVFTGGMICCSFRSGVSERVVVFRLFSGATPVVVEG